METDRLKQVAQREIDNHLSEADRLKGIALDLIANAEWHCSQADSWNEYLRGIIMDATVVQLEFAIPEQRQPERHLTLLQGGLDA